MPNTVYFRRPLCRAVDSIGFESQVNLYLRRDLNGGEIGMEKIATANVGVVDGMLMADFYLDDTLFAQPEEVVVSSLFAAGPPEAGLTPATAIHITGLIIARRWPTDVQ